MSPAPPPGRRTFLHIRTPSDSDSGRYQDRPTPQTPFPQLCFRGRLGLGRSLTATPSKWRNQLQKPVHVAPNLPLGTARPLTPPLRASGLGDPTAGRAVPPARSCSKELRPQEEETGANTYPIPALLLRFPGEGLTSLRSELGRRHWAVGWGSLSRPLSEVPAGRVQPLCGVPTWAGTWEGQRPPPGSRPGGPPLGSSLGGCCWRGQGLLHCSLEQGAHSLTVGGSGSLRGDKPRSLIQLCQ